MYPVGLAAPAETGLRIGPRGRDRGEDARPAPGSGEHDVPLLLGEGSRLLDHNRGGGEGHITEALHREEAPVHVEAAERREQGAVCRVGGDKG